MTTLTIGEEEAFALDPRTTDQIIVAVRESARIARTLDGAAEAMEGDATRRRAKATNHAAEHASLERLLLRRLRNGQ